MGESETIAARYKREKITDFVAAFCFMIEESPTGIYLDLLGGDGNASKLKKRPKFKCNRILIATV
jgi:hypothetical protein